MTALISASCVILRVVRHVELNAVAEQARVEAALPLGRPLGLQAVVADRVERLDRRVGVLDARRARAEYVRSASFGPGCTPDAPFATRRRRLLIALKTLSLREEVLVGEHPRQARLRIVDALEVRAERAVLVGAHRRRQEQAIAKRRALLRRRCPTSSGACTLRDAPGVAPALAVTAPGGSVVPAALFWSWR